MGSQRWLAPIAAAIACGMLWAATPSWRFLSDCFAALSLGFLVWALVIAIRPRRRDKYDLGLLREVHEREEIDSLEPEEPEDFDSVHCPCGCIYPLEVPVCPACGRPQGQW